MAGSITDTLNVTVDDDPGVLATGDQAITQTQVVGHRWSARSFEVRDFLARSSVPYRWLTVEQPEGRRPLEAAAGLGAAVYTASEGLRMVLVERQATGGQVGQSSRIENYLGFPDGVSGAQLTERARRQAHKFGAELLTARNVTGLEARGWSRVIRFGDGGEIAAHTVVLATGVAYHSVKRVASAVGEGAMAIQLVHRYLEAQ